MTLMSLLFIRTEVYFTYTSNKCKKVGLENNKYTYKNIIACKKIAISMKKLTFIANYYYIRVSHLKVLKLNFPRLLLCTGRYKTS